MRLFNNMSIENNELIINGNSTIELAKRFKTPLYVLDGDYVKSMCREIKNSFKHDILKTEILYASKAFSCKSIYKLIENEGLSIDVVSSGELYTAIKADFPMGKIYFHGNNKSEFELKMALTNNIHRIVVDNLAELELLEILCNENNKKINILLRINPGISAHTHEYVQTAKEDSKFGISFKSTNLVNAINLCIKSSYIKLVGLHCHIGSQIHEASSFYNAMTVMIKNYKILETRYNLNMTELNLGGGFGVFYDEEDLPILDFSFLSDLTSKCYELIKSNNLFIEKLIIEPGRVLIANAGTTLYKVGFSKKTITDKNYIFIDGGMSDNPRPALYQAKYQACIANKMDNNYNTLYTVAGKCCESSDILIHDIILPTATRNDILAVSSTGAYNYSMASNYNRIPRAAVIMIENTVAKLIIERESLEDLITLDK